MGRVSVEITCEPKGVESENREVCYFPSLCMLITTSVDPAIMDIGIGTAYTVFGYGVDDHNAGC